MTSKKLSTKQNFAFIAEVTSTRNLLAYGARVVRTAAFIDTTRDPILTMLSIGFEKLYKLTLGLLSLDDNGKWPSKEQMKEYGHNLGVMHDHVMLELERRTANSTPYVRTILARTKSDPVVRPFINALDTYGRSGRFYHLNMLGEVQQTWEGPDHYWQEIETATAAEPDIQQALSAAMGDVTNGKLWDQVRLMQNQRIANSVETLWEMIAICGRNNALGEAGKPFGFEVHPNAVGHQ